MRLLPRLAGTLARVSARFVPDAFSIACLLTFLTLGLALAVGGASPASCVRAWGDGFWSLLSFSMQIAVVIFAGYLLAVAPPVRRGLDKLARVPRTPPQAVAWTALLSMALCWLNWGMGLIASAVLVRVVARRHPRADYRLLVAMAYLGMGATWHAGPSGSVPLLLATPGSFMVRDGLIEDLTQATSKGVGLRVVVKQRRSVPASCLTQSASVAEASALTEARVLFTAPTIFVVATIAGLKLRSAPPTPVAVAVTVKSAADAELQGIPSRQMKL